MLLLFEWKKRRGDAAHGASKNERNVLIDFRSFSSPQKFFGSL
ncbi:uncharacterized protein CELE_C10C6.13 [Caenorhabditis elegans]|uniref:Uncharacterized protein n=1 Tax=Caenorhabditis elegans TaxID=6239 RepID=I7KSD1_CAEEL|nr:Uncharacterized protein CELE_C10C6.13 [Caenorhabditis elegans]CCJ09413.1 Uncharacterized protein CELE_C10C6.13 [Caenorhabditis elegans]|eukprot:NP_001263791.1 Uncharacterized protein CELE_C10C6.13 [Caenorhabditis elegans]